MGSDGNWNGLKEGTSFHAEEKQVELCTNGCGFFGTAANRNLCSKCYRELLIREEQEAFLKAALNKSIHSLPPPPSKQEKQPISSPALSSPSSSSSASASLGVEEESVSEKPEEGKGRNRCMSVNCKKKVGLTGFKCRCGYTYCSVHRYPEDHLCTFDFKSSARDAIARANPIVKADKVCRI